MDTDAPTLLIILLIIIVFTVIVIVLRICFSRWIAKKKAQLRNQQLQSTSEHNSQVRSTSGTSERMQSDHQIVFGRTLPQPLPNISRLNTATPATQTVQEIAEQLRLDSLQMQYERRAQERRDTLDRFINFLHMPPRLDTTNNGVHGVTTEQLSDVTLNSVTESRESTRPNNVSDSTPAPRYISQDDELPSYEEAIATTNINR